MAILPSRTGADGFTLVEMLVVLAIVGLLLLATPVLLSAGRPGLAAKAAARTLAHDLMAARQKAIFEDIETDVALNAAAGSYSVSPGGPVHVLPGDLGLTFRVGRASVPRGRIRFFPDGSSTGGTIELGGQGHRYRIVADWLSGRVSVSD